MWVHGGVVVFFVTFFHSCTSAFFNTCTAASFEIHNGLRQSLKLIPVELPINREKVPIDLKPFEEKVLEPGTSFCFMDEFDNFPSRNEIQIDIGRDFMLRKVNIVILPSEEIVGEVCLFYNFPEPLYFCHTVDNYSNTVLFLKHRRYGGANAWYIEVAEKVKN